MFNAAVKAKTLMAGGSLASGLANVNTVRNFFSENDPVLGGAYRVWATGKRALGSRRLGSLISPLARDYDDLDMMDPAVAGSPACTHSKHLSPGDWGYGRTGAVTGDPRCYGVGFEHSQLFKTLARQIDLAGN